MSVGAVRAALPRPLRLMVAGLITLAGVAPARAAQAQPARYQVLVNDENPVATLTRAELSRLFLKKTVAWKTGGAVVPVDLSEGSDVRRSFSRDVLKKDVAAVKGYWQQLLFTGRAVPPVEKASEAEVVAYVAANRNAIGYVSVSTGIGAGVKAVRVMP